METSPKSSDDSITAISRIKEYPVIKDSFSKAGEYYNWIKSKNSTLTSTLNWTENAVKDVVQKVEPVATSHLESLDKYACTKLDNLETKFPIVKESSEEVLKSTSDYYETSIKPNVVYAATTPYRITTQTIETLSNTANTLVSKYLGSSPTDASKDGSTSVTQQTYALTFKQAVKEIEVIRRYTSENIHNLTNLLSSICNKTVTNNEEWIRKYYEEFRTEVDSKDDKASVGEDTNSKLMKLALNLSNRLRISVRAMSTVCYNHLSVDYREKLDLVFAKTEQLYNSVNKSTYENVRDQISMENVHWIGENALKILGTVKDTVLERYKEHVGHDASNDVDVKETCDGDSADQSNDGSQ